MYVLVHAYARELSTFEIVPSSNGKLTVRTKGDNCIRPIQPSNKKELSNVFSLLPNPLAIVSKYCGLQTTTRKIKLPGRETCRRLTAPGSGSKSFGSNPSFLPRLLCHSVCQAVGPSVSWPICLLVSVGLHACWSVSLLVCMHVALSVS